MTPGGVLESHLALPSPPGLPQPLTALLESSWSFQKKPAAAARVRGRQHGVGAPVSVKHLGDGGGNDRSLKATTPERHKP